MIARTVEQAAVEDQMFIGGGAVRLRAVGTHHADACTGRGRPPVQHRIGRRIDEAESDAHAPAQQLAAGIEIQVEVVGQDGKAGATPAREHLRDARGRFPGRQLAGAGHDAGRIGHQSASQALTAASFARIHVCAASRGCSRSTFTSRSISATASSPR